MQAKFQEINIVKQGITKKEYNCTRINKYFV